MAPKTGTALRGDGAILEALAEGCTWAEAADRAGVSRRTVARRMERPAFRVRLAELRREAFDRGAAVLASSLVECSRRLVDIALQPASAAVLPTATRLRALGMVLDAAADHRQVTDFDDRLCALEARANLRGKR